MAMDIQKALKLGQFVSAAYSPVGSNPVKYALPFNYQVVQVLYANDLATDINADQGGGSIRLHRAIPSARSHRLRGRDPRHREHLGMDAGRPLPDGSVSIRHRGGQH